MPSAYTQSTNQPELQLAPGIQTTCPSSTSLAYVKDGESSPRPQISLSVLQERLAKLDLSAGAPVRQQAKLLGAKCGIEAVELLHMAICRAARPRTSRPDVDLLPYLAMLMRSIASGIAKARRRAAERGILVPIDYVHGQVTCPRSILDPVAAIQRAQEQQYFANLIEELHGGDPLLVQLVDAIGMGRRGKPVQQQLGVSATEFASLRRRLKRRAACLVDREGLRYC